VNCGAWPVRQEPHGGSLFVRYILVGASAGMMPVIATSVVTRVAQRVLLHSQFVEVFP
jgi:hypothetical protein